jgi:HupE / UreJ protein.
MSFPQFARALAVLLVSIAGLARAHDVPADIRIVAFVKPERERLVLLLRVPLAAMREVDVPMRGPGYLDLARAEPALRTAAQLWLTDNLDVYENGTKLSNAVVADTRVSLASDRSFGDFDSASAHMREPRVPATEQLYWSQQLLDARVEYAGASANSSFAIRPRFDRLAERVSTTLHFLPQAGVERVFELHGDPGLVTLDPSWHQAAWRFVREGFLHILDGIDHLLFIACLVIPFRKVKPLIVIATAFTIAHSITLACAATGLAPQGLWFPPLVETLIAVSVFYLAVENLFGSSAQRRWVIAFAFGLVHGFGFAFALRESLQFAGAHLATALVAFNVGVELGQVAVLLVLGAGARLHVQARAATAWDHRALRAHRAHGMALDARALRGPAQVHDARDGCRGGREYHAMGDRRDPARAGGVGGEPEVEIGFPPARERQLSPPRRGRCGRCASRATRRASPRDARRA